MLGQKGMVHYSGKAKEEVVYLHEKEGMMYPALAEQLGMRKAEQIKRGVYADRQEGE